MVITSFLFISHYPIVLDTVTKVWPTLSNGVLANDKIVTTAINNNSKYN